MPIEPLSGNQVKAPISGKINIEPGDWVSVVGTDNAVKMKGFALKNSLANGSSVSEGNIIGENPSGFQRFAYKKNKSGNLESVPNYNDFIKGTTTGNKPEEKSQSTIKQYSKLSEVPGVQGMVGTTLPQIGLASKVINQTESTDNQSDILTEELKKMRKLINF
jgi:hypothetical protein